MTDSFKHSALFYDLIYGDKNTSSEVDYIESLIQAYSFESKNILEFGSGTGRHAEIFVQRGYSVHGIECSREMIDNCVKVDNFTCEEGDVKSKNIGQIFDVVTAVFHVVSYQTSFEDLTAIFSNASIHLNSGGLFIFDFWFSPAVYSQKPEVRVKNIDKGQIHVTRIAQPKVCTLTNTVTVNYEFYVRNAMNGILDTYKESHILRHLSIPEIDVLSSLTGFSRVYTKEWLTGDDPSMDTWGVCCVLKKL